MTCDICGMHDIWVNMSGFNLFFIWDKLRNKKCNVGWWKKNSNKFAKVNYGETEHNLLKLEKDSNKNAQKFLKFAMKVLR